MGQVGGTNLSDGVRFSHHPKDDWLLHWTRQAPTHAYRQFGYDGKDYLTLNEDRSTWTAADAAAEITHREWEATNAAEYWRVYLESPCMVWLFKYLMMGNETLLRSGRRGQEVTPPDELEFMSPENGDN